MATKVQKTMYNMTPEESGLGGLPIEADMRYTGGFMPYGAKEKADDVPARLRKTNLYLLPML